MRQQRHIVLGVYQSDIEGLRARFKADSREVEMKQLQKRAFVEDAIKHGKIDSETVLNMQNVGYSDGTALLAKTGKVYRRVVRTHTK
jgi:predicted esterase